MARPRSPGRSRGGRVSDDAGEAYDGRTTEQRGDWVLSRLEVADIGKDEARRARRLLADAELHGHKYAIHALLAVVARQQ
ncbi:hypothetical protein ABZ154_26215 [Streptomyces sp. NPDC006261]|uniref:hypothetical protein n=1 Tax=Streptomyces sp. NPDC006261 TaxID=3156739 RepID=UPI00339FB855